MLKVRVKGPAVKLQGIWKFIDETAEIEQEEYDANKDYLEVISGEVKNKKTEPQNPSGDEDKELLALREKAKDLGIKGAHNMKKENLIEKIEEAEKANNSGTDDEGNEGEETGEDGTEGGQPQE